MQTTETLQAGQRVFLRNGRKHWVVRKQDGGYVHIYHHDGFKLIRKKVLRRDVRAI